LTVVIDDRQSKLYGERMGANGTSAPTTSAREFRRLETRARLFEAAVAEIARSGLSGADVSAIASSAGVVRGTFYFHFPTKEHVLLELERSEEAKIVAELGHPGTKRLETILTELVRKVLASERRLGPVVFRDMLGLHFSSARPAEDELAEHPLAEFVVTAVAAAQSAGQVSPHTEPGEVAVFFMTGLFALLATGAQDSRKADALLRRYVTTIVKGVEIR
jgi:AcrR family transcriptional regulator